MLRNVSFNAGSYLPWNGFRGLTIKYSVTDAEGTTGTSVGIGITVNLIG